MVADPFEAQGLAVHRRSAAFASTAAAGALATVAMVALGVVATGLDLVGAFGLPRALPALALAHMLPIAFLVLRYLPDHPYPRFGPANAVTVLRGGLAALIAAFAWDASLLSGEGGDGLLWGLVAAATLALSLDGVDGMLARRTGLASPFGERFDMETDAYLILILCALAHAAGKAGAFVFLIGLMRYGFCVWALREPRLQQPLSPSFRRKAVCVLQIALLGVVLLPVVPPAVSNALAVVALLALGWSFAVDVAALLRRSA